MKLRVRINKETSCVEMEAADPSLTDFSVLVKEVVIPSIGLSADTEFSLSLNGKELLVDTGQTLSSCGVVSGDLISVILLQSSPSSSQPPSTSQKTQNSTYVHQGSQQSCTMSVMPSSSNQAGSSSSQRSGESTEPEMEERWVEEEEEAVGPFIPEPMLCCEAEQGKVPHSLEMLFQAAQCQSTSDCLLVAAHLLLLESGFLPKGCDVRAGEMPSGWRAAGGVYKLQYTHPYCENSLALVVAVPMGKTLVINATLKTDRTVENACKLLINPAVYVTEGWTGGNAGAAYKDMQTLSRVFKDQLAYPFIAAARQTLGLPALFGLAVLPPELLLRILRLLDVRALLSLSAVCTHLHTATQDPTLWRHLLHRDFRVRDQRNSEHRETDWKELYKRKYKLSRCRVRRYPFPIPHFDPIAPVPMRPVPLHIHPPGIIGGEYDERPSIPQGIFPRPRYDRIGLLPGHEPNIGLPFGRRSVRQSGTRPADIRRGFI